ncbi:hypothetical protein HOLleu_21171 [Holothuria leucospilota]|uniref:Uncharacterized protein n=1 Tax=Holothuria leucospilota TaxID=206669 RepID=A0A9Q1BXK0_HOLLE|nr:hypothetical protein HOLleu_21171 [Holothuria leucospilota]
MSNKQKTYDDLIDLLLQEEMIHSSSKERAVFLKERSPDKASDMALLADKYREAHGNYDKGRVLRIGLETKISMIKMGQLKAKVEICLVPKREEKPEHVLYVENLVTLLEIVGIEQKGQPTKLLL